MTAQGAIRRTAGRDDWRTPRDLFDLLNRRFRFTLDAAADDDNHLVSRYLTGPCEPMFRESCGLCADWLDHRVFVNPPYGDDLPAWVEKFDHAAKRGAFVVAVLPVATDTAWFVRVLREAKQIAFLTGRVQFWHPEEEGGRNGGGSMVAIYGPDKLPGLAFVRTWAWKENEP